jgi:hypothetical protein
MISPLQDKLAVPPSMQHGVKLQQDENKQDGK